VDPALLGYHIDTGAAIYPEEWPEGGGPAPDDPNRKVIS
jgi:hypothetical protein